MIEQEQAQHERRTQLAVLTSEVTGSLYDAIHHRTRGVLDDSVIQEAHDDHRQLVQAEREIVEVLIKTESMETICTVAGQLALIESLSPWTVENTSDGPQIVAGRIDYYGWLAEVDQSGQSKAEQTADLSMEISVVLVAELPESSQDDSLGSELRNE